MEQGKIKAYILFSGGLDSMLAAAVLRSQGIEIAGVSFSSPFYDCANARASARELGLPLTEIDISDEMIALIKNPPSGYGKRLNPCIDCHALMARKAHEYALKERLQVQGQYGIIIASGEVLEQRHFSQSRNALRRVEELAGTPVLRPLSAKLLPETEYEKKGWVVRGKLYGISGRSREQNFSLAEKFGIKSYPSPAGGCLLTDPAMSERFLKLVDWDGSSDKADYELVKNGRMYWGNLRLPGTETAVKALVVIGRNELENEKLETLAQKGDFMIKLKEDNGPTTIVRLLGGVPETDKHAQEIRSVMIPLKPDFNPGSDFKNLGELFEAAMRISGYYFPRIRGTQALFHIIKRGACIGQ